MPVKYTGWPHVLEFLEFLEKSWIFVCHEKILETGTNFPIFLQIFCISWTFLLILESIEVILRFFHFAILILFNNWKHRQVFSQAPIWTFNSPFICSGQPTFSHCYQIMVI